LLLHTDGKNYALGDTPAHRAIYGVDSSHRFGVCIFFKVHLIPNQRDFFQKDRCHAYIPLKSRDLPALIANTPLRLKKILYFFLKQKEYETTSQSTLH